MIELGIVSKIVVIGYYMFQKHSNHTPKNRSALVLTFNTTSIHI